MALQQATFGAGCFWGVQDVFDREPGVLRTLAGYSGGRVVRPWYEEVCDGRTGDAEVVQVIFDPEQTSFERLLEVFWGCHDPTQLNRQGVDVGTQYRSVIFAHGEEQLAAALASKAALESSGSHTRPVVTEIVAAGVFWRAEDYHQRYFARLGIDPTCRR